MNGGIHNALERFSSTAKLHVIHLLEYLRAHIISSLHVILYCHRLQSIKLAQVEWQLLWQFYKAWHLFVNKWTWFAWYFRSLMVRILKLTAMHRKRQLGECLARALNPPAFKTLPADFFFMQNRGKWGLEKEIMGQPLSLFSKPSFAR